MSNDITSAWVGFIDSWLAKFGQEPVTLAQVATLPGARQWMKSGTTQELGAALKQHAALHPTLRAVRLRDRYAYPTKAGRIRKPAIWALRVIRQGVYQHGVLGYEDGIPVVAATARQHKGVTLLTLVACPYCGRQHEHGGREGHRLAHCDLGGAGGYIVKIGGTV
jgi:hypothetical protein